jgi:signal transduction histidine kinase
MTASADKLRATLADLHAQLDDVEQLDPEVRDLLRDALAEIHETLEHRASGEETGAAEQESLAQGLRELVDRFESSHPTLAGAVGSVIDALGRMGI